MAEERGEDKGVDELVDGITTMLNEQGVEAFSKAVVAEFRNPSNVGRMEAPDGEGLADGLCNDTMEMFIRVDGDRIGRCMFYTDGCGVTIACGSVLTRLVTGKTIEDAAEVQSSEIESALDGLPDDHKHCATLAVIAFRNALRDYERKHGGREV